MNNQLSEEGIAAMSDESMRLARATGLLMACAGYVMNDPRANDVLKARLQEFLKEEEAKHE